MELFRGGRIPRVGVLSNYRPVLRAENRQNPAEMLSGELCEPFISEPARTIVHYREPGILPLFPLPINEFEAALAPRGAGPCSPPIGNIFFRSYLFPGLIHFIVRIIEGVVEIVIVHRYPHRPIQQVPATLLYDRADQVPPASDGQSRDCRISPELDDGFHIPYGILRHDLFGVRRLLLVLPLCGEVRLIVELEVPDSCVHELLDDRKFPFAEGGFFGVHGVGLIAIYPHDWNDPVFQERRRYVQASVVEQLDPFDPHGLEFGDPEILHLSKSNGRGRPRSPMDSDPGIFRRSWVFR